jgi:hypothetical protein
MAVWGRGLLLSGTYFAEFDSPQLTYLIIADCSLQRESTTVPYYSMYCTDYTLVSVLSMYCTVLYGRTTDCSVTIQYCTDSRTRIPDNG